MTAELLGHRADDQIVYLSTLSFSDEWLEDLRALSDRLVVIQRTCDTPAGVPDEVWREVRILQTSTVFPHPSQVPKLAWVQLDTSGVDHVVGQPLWQETMVPVTTIGGISAQTMAEYVVLMLLAFSHRLPGMLDLQHRRRWPCPEDRWRLFKPVPLAGSKVAIIGFGRIGRAAGLLCAGLGMDVVGIRRDGGPLGVEDPGPVGSGFPVGWVTQAPIESLREVLMSSDAVVVTAPLTPQTRGLLDRNMLLSIKPGAVLVNVSRGGIVDEATVGELLAAGHLAGAAFDVFGQEPLPPEDPLWSTPNLIISPHIAGFAPDYSRQVKALVTENLRRFLAGRPLLNQADRSAGY